MLIQPRSCKNLRKKFGAAPHAGGQYIPRLWLLSDARNDASLESSLAALPAGSAFLYRHHHLDNAARHKRYRHLNRLCRQYRLLIFLSDTAKKARQWRADGFFNAAPRRSGKAGLILVMPVHNHKELARARHGGADAILLSPIFPTASHPGAPALGILQRRALLLRACTHHSRLPVILLGGMNAKNSRQCNLNGAHGWAAIDGLSQ